MPETPKISIRPATVADVDGIMGGFHEYFAAHPDAHKPFSVDPSRWFFALLNLLSNARNAAVIVAECDGAIAGAVCMELVQGTFNPHELVACERFWVVRDAFRHRPRITLSLFYAAEQWAREAHADVIAFGALSGSAATVERFYRKNGYTDVSQTFARRIT